MTGQFIWDNISYYRRKTHLNSYVIKQKRAIVFKISLREAFIKKNHFLIDIRQ